MQYYRLDEYDRQDNDFCFIYRPPAEINLLSSFISSGIAATSEYPDNVTAIMSSDRGGILLSDFIANRNLSIITHKIIKESIKELCASSCEYLPVSIQNHKGRIASSDYFYINPLGSYECLNYNKSVIKYTDDGKIISVDKFVLDENKLKDVPDLFRVPEDKYVYFISQRLVDAIREKKPDVTNMNLEHIEVSLQN